MFGDNIKSRFGLINFGSSRDDRDMNRKLNPLKIADGAVLIDSTDINIDEVVEEILSNIEER